ncbi:MAG: hypothetical protein ACYTBS_08475 [Planctomycetota bacterium]|jgi:hypothetical protein
MFGRQHILLATLVFVVAFCACVGNRAWTREDSWYTEPELALPWDAELKYELISSVPSSGLALAEQLLESRSWRRLSVAEVMELLGKDADTPTGKHLYLLRAVYLNAETGGFSVRHKDGIVHVHHSSLGRRAVPMKRGAVIVPLNSDPENVYVTCSMDE